MCATSPSFAPRQQQQQKIKRRTDPFQRPCAQERKTHASLGDLAAAAHGRTIKKPFKKHLKCENLNGCLNGPII